MSVSDATLAYDNGYYKNKLEEGLKYQDLITDVLYNNGIVVVTYVSRERSRAGENKLGVEIKRDGRFRDTGNLYIETAEKSHPRRPEFIKSGIFRDDNSWLYAIGDEKTIWLFPKKYLQMLSGRYRYTQIATSRGYLIPIGEADKYCIRRIDI